MAKYGGVINEEIYFIVNAYIFTLGGCNTRAARGFIRISHVPIYNNTVTLLSRSSISTPIFVLCK